MFSLKAITEMFTGGCLPLPGCDLSGVGGKLQGALTAITVGIGDLAEYVFHSEHPLLILGIIVVVGVVVYRAAKTVAIIGLLLALMLLLVYSLPEIIKLP